MDFDDEASKLLEKALSSFDGIILGEKISQNFYEWVGKISTPIIHKSRLMFSNCKQLFFVGDKNAHQQPSTSNVLSAAQTLALALQQCRSSPPSPPDKETAETINAWLENYLPVSVCCWSLKPIECCLEQIQISLSVERIKLSTAKPMGKSSPINILFLIIA